MKGGVGPSVLPHQYLVGLGSYVQLACQADVERASEALAALSAWLDAHTGTDAGEEGVQGGSEEAQGAAGVAARAGAQGRGGGGAMETAEEVHADAEQGEQLRKALARALKVVSCVCLWVCCRAGAQGPCLGSLDHICIRHVSCLCSNLVTPSAKPATPLLSWVLYRLKLETNSKLERVTPRALLSRALLADVERRQDAA